MSKPQESAHSGADRVIYYCDELSQAKPEFVFGPDTTERLADLVVRNAVDLTRQARYFLDN
jgi:hypothetical protein